jgi:excisionase family DNA binding protein
VAVVTAPALVLNARDCRWLGPLLEDLLGRGYFDSAPALRDRAVEVCNELHVVASGGQTGDELLSVEDAAAVLKCSTSTVRRRLRDRSLSPVRLGGLVRVRRGDLEASS